MKKIVCLILAFSLLAQPLAIPLSVLAQTPSTPTPTQSGPTSGTTQPLPSPSSSSFSYDSSGNLLDDGTRVITWDVEGKPVRIVKGDLETTFLYDSSGGRIGKIVKDKQTGQLQSATIYFGGNLEKELNPDGTTKSTTKYYFAGGKRIAQRKNESGKPEELTYIHTDHLSSSTFLTDSSGNKKDTLLTYYPYGKTRTGWDTPSLASIATNRLYTGQIKDQETDLYYYHARYYNQRTGLFISPDTAGNSLNKYAYVNSNPLIFSDPTGHMDVDITSGSAYNDAGPMGPPGPDRLLPFRPTSLKGLLLGLINNPEEALWLLHQWSESPLPIFSFGEVNGTLWVSPTGEDIQSFMGFLVFISPALSDPFWQSPKSIGSAKAAGIGYSQKGVFRIPKGAPSAEIVAKANARGIPEYALNAWTDEEAFALYDQAVAKGVKFKFSTRGGAVRHGEALAGENPIVGLDRGSFDTELVKHEVEHIYPTYPEACSASSEWPTRRAAYEYISSRYPPGHPLVEAARERMYWSLVDWKASLGYYEYMEELYTRQTGRSIGNGYLQPTK